MQTSTPLATTATTIWTVSPSPLVASAALAPLAYDHLSAANVAQGKLIAQNAVGDPYTGKSLDNLIDEFTDGVSIGNAVRRLATADMYYMGCYLLKHFKTTCEVYKDYTNMSDVINWISPQLYVLTLVRNSRNPTNQLLLPVQDIVDSGLGPFYTANA